MSAVASPPPEVSLSGKRNELIALSKQLCEAHLAIRETATLLKRESNELSKESRVLRKAAHRLRRTLDVEACTGEVVNS